MEEDRTLGLSEPKDNMVKEKEAAGKKEASSKRQREGREEQDSELGQKLRVEGISKKAELASAAACPQVTHDRYTALQVHLRQCPGRKFI